MFFQQHRKYLLVFLLCAVDLLSATNPHGSRHPPVTVSIISMRPLDVLEVQVVARELVPDWQYRLVASLSISADAGPHYETDYDFSASSTAASFTLHLPAAAHDECFLEMLIYSLYSGLREDEALLCKHERKYLLPFTGVDTHGVNKDVPSSAQTRGASIRGVGTEMKGERAKRTAAEGVRDESRAGVGITGHEKFDAFCEHVCAMCDKRDHDCGCDVGVDSGVFQLLYNYTRQYEAWAAQATYWADNDYQVTAGSPGAMEGVKFVIVDVCCGIGNHLLMAARGLMLALRLGRALIINEENEVVYALTSVLPLISPDVAARLGWPHRSTKIIATDHRDGHLGVEFYTCGDWHALEDHDFIQLQGMEDVHMMMLHPDEGSWFRSYFGDTPFFFLSHFLWSGTEQMSFPVRTESWPRTEQYSGQNFSIEGLISTLRDDAAGALAPDHHRAAILGVQLRVGGSITTKLEHNVIDLVGDGTSEEQEAQGEVGEQGEPRSLVADYASNSHWEQLLLFPHGHLLEEEWDGLDLSPLARYCLGDKTALDVVQPCIAKAISDLKNSAQTERILLLLATDREEPLQDLINSVSAQPGVTVVRIYAAKHVDTKIRHLSQQLRALSPDDSRTLEVRRQRALLATGVGLVDVVVLPEVCEGFLGTAHSTYSFAIHARARLIPRYTGHTQDGCYKARSSEGGLISLSPQLSPAQELEGSCTMAYFTATHGCIETRAHCLSTDHISAWAEPLAISFDWFGFYALMYARSGWRDIFFVSHTGIVCNNPHEKEVVSGQILPILRDFQQFGPRGNNQQRTGNAEKRSERTEGGGTNPNLDASCRRRDDTDGWECDKKHDDIPISHPLMSGASHTCAEQGALAPLGSVSIVIHRDALGQEDVSVWDKFDGFFEVSVRFAVIFQDDAFNADDIDTVVFSTGEDVMHVRGVGHHEVVLRKLEEGFHQIRFIAVNASCLFSDSSIRRCVYEDDRTGGLTGCLGVLGGGALPMLKVNLYGYTLLSPAMDPASLYKDQAAGYQKRPVAWEIACGYSVCGMGHVLSDLVVILNGSYLGAVSPLVPNPGMQLEESDWSCRFMLQKLSGQGGAVRWTSVGGVETTKAVFESDWMHTFRLLCAIPSHLQSQLVGNSTREKREGGRALKQSRVLGGLFRDGVPLNMQAETSETNAPWQSDRDKEPEASSEEEAAIGLSRLVYDPLVRSHPGGNEERRGSVEICTMVRDEEENVEEFVEYHLLLGVRHIHVYLHMTRDSTAHRLEKYVRQGVVTLRAWDFDWSSMWIRYQAHALNDCLLRSLANPDTTWSMMLDVDEFLVPAAALARSKLPRSTFFAPQDAEQEALGYSSLANLIPHTLDLLQAAALQRVSRDAGTQSDGTEPVVSDGVSAFKVSWLPFSSHRDTQSPSTLTLDVFTRHSTAFMPEAKWARGDQLNGKILARGSVHTDFPGHCATIAHGGVAVVNVSTLFIAHYIGRNRQREADVDSDLSAGSRRRRSDVDVGCF